MSFGKIKIDNADRYFSLWIRNRDKWTCQRCGTYYAPPTTALQCSHFVGRGKENTRFMPENCDAICFGCHQYFTSNPQEHYAWQIQRKGQNMVDKIHIAGNLYHKKTRKLEAHYWKTKLSEDFGINA